MEKLSDEVIPDQFFGIGRGFFFCALREPFLPHFR
jgi:hypothetical protein